ncbi:methionine--tRNA ligase [Capsulimonas corticalis]|uniref:Methionine--tRNA ligase n=1 Tax=Capsulimonas corticalis TaxID=2219043 RepID=A0A402CT52_9BACT|nr:methionine--tRNA ligase [Capsulimonas corticalis]BDI30847.1 methionine--tRNA ligase [Capsulimonas corticalis]
MADSKKFYLTTPIYYVNGVPHVGSATTTLVADALARYHRQRGEEVFFLTGTDENAQKVSDAAAKLGEETQAFVDRISNRFVETWKFLDISYDDFIRTTEPRHKEVVAEVFRRLRDRGDIYAGKYEGWYSVSDETFFRDSEVKDGVAIESGAKVERVTEDVYYFKLSAYGERLREYIHANPSFLQPDTRRNEVLAFIDEGLRDVAVSRRNTGWGIETPDDPSQVVYVWFDALINYLAATGWPGDTNWDTLWPADVHLVGKEIYVRFHATLWPAMLMGLDLPLPAHVLGHGWWLVGGEKGAKSKGNIPTPQEAVDYLVAASGATQGAAIDALRYYLIRDISFTGDAEFSLSTLVEHFNFQLANDLGNLLNRTLNMLKQYEDSVITEAAAATAESSVATLAQEVYREATDALESLNPGAALVATWKLIAAANKAIDTSAPWKRHKEGDKQGVIEALYEVLEANRIASVLIAPFMPYASARIREQLGLDPSVTPAWETASQWGLLATGTQTLEAQPIFPRINLKELNAKEASSKPSKEKKIVSETTPTPEATAAAATTPVTETAPATEAAAPAEVIDDTITIDDVIKLKLKVAEIKTAERIKGADKLLHLTIDVGEEAPRNLIAGIAESYAPEDLPGKKIVVIANLAPRKMRGVYSQGMLLAATDENGRAILLTPESEVGAGAEVR